MAEPIQSFTPFSEMSLINLLREYSNASFDAGAKDANGDRDVQAITNKLNAIESELKRREQAQAVENERLRAALEYVRDYDYGGSIAFDNVRDVAREALQPQEAK